MIKNESRESAHLRSRVKDRSVVPNLASFNGLFAAITPIAKLKKNAEQLYDPILVRDTDTLIANFGDPRIDPEKYIDLYSIMQLVGNGGTCYVSKVNSGTTGTYQFPFVADKEYGTDNITNSIIELTESQTESNVWVKDDLNNKYIVNGVTGTVNSSTVDYVGRYTWECAPSSTPGKFCLKVTLPLSSGEAEPSTLVASANVDPSWGSEEIKFSPVEVSSGNYVKDNGNNTTSVTFTSNVLTHEYIFTELDNDSLPSELKHSSVSYKIFYDDHKYTVVFTAPDVDDTPTHYAWNVSASTTFKAGPKTRTSHSMIAYSSMNDDLTFEVYLSQAKPYAIKAYYLNVTVSNSNGKLASAKLRLTSTTTNQGIANALNSSLGTVVRFELIDQTTASASGVKDRGANSIAQNILDTYCDGGNVNLVNPVALVAPVTIESPSFSVTVNDYIDALEQYKAKKYVGCLMADMVCPVTKDSGEETTHDLYPLSSNDRRTLHYYLKDIAFERKDTTVILSTPYTQSYNNTTPFDIDEACDWVMSQNMYNELWEYGAAPSDDYAVQSFYLEMYFSWLEMACDWVADGKAQSKNVKVAPANLVVNNILKSWRERGVQYPVAGDQGGILPDSCSVLVNPKTKLERDQLVQNRINPIWDTGTRGVQIFGNETLNAGYTDLNAAHIARALVYIRSTIDEYTEKLKFSINSMVLWDQWKAYVSQNILEPLKSSNCLAEYRIAMGEDTTSREEIANRQINGIVQLIFYQSAELFDLTYTVYSSATTIDEAMANT